MEATTAFGIGIIFIFLLIVVFSIIFRPRPFNKVE